MTALHEAVWQRLITAKKPALLAHKNPDLDTLGSALALHHALERSGVKSALIVPELPIAAKYGFLPGIERFKAAFPRGCDLLVALDAGDPKLLIADRPDVELIVIDHHQSNTHYGAINLVRPECGSTGEVVADLLEASGVGLNAKIATCLYAAIASDTRFFITDRVDANTFGLAARLIEAGADAEAIGGAITRSRPLSELRLTGRVLSGMTLIKDASVAAAIVRQNDLSACGADLADCSDLSEWLLSAVTAEVAVLLIERPQGLVKGSLRCKSDRDVSTIAAFFGGGGHKKAAGFTVRGEADEIMAQIAKML